MQDIPEKIAVRIKKVPISNGHICWIWTGSFTSDGHPQLEIEGRNQKVIPYLFRLWVSINNLNLKWNRLRRKKTCTSKKCINPRHFDPAPIMRKVQMKGVGKGGNPAGHPKPEHIQGIKNPNVRLNESKVLQIRERYSKGSSVVQLSKDFSVTQTQIKRIVSGQNWKHI